MDILSKEQVKIDRLFGHGGYFKTPVVSQSVMTAATGVPVSVMETAGEGGAWGMALLAAFHGERREGGNTGGLSGKACLCRSKRFHAGT